ncbi:MAG: type II and III secretion system protein family protein [Phenylobacterium sp.]|nr:MAG: type II and III secretion system protein family protein [Phenylobacterium sp.]
MQSVLPMTRPLLAAIACALSLGAVAAQPAKAAVPMAAEAVVSRSIVVPKDKSASFRLAEPASRIVVAQDEIAQVVATSDRSFYVRGKDIGATNLLVYGPGGRLAEVIDLYVSYDASAMQEALGVAFPSEHIRVSTMGEGLLLTGQVSNTGVAARAQKIAEKYAPDFVTNNLTVRASQEVILEVRVMEATRSALQDFGINATVGNSSFQFASGTGLISGNTPQGVLSLTGGSGHTSIDVQLQALETKGLIRTLARPNLVAVSGEKASFLAGGEFPFPVPQGLNEVTIEFRPYGVKLNFTPTVEDNGLIRLDVEPEVSALDPANSLRLSNITVPALTTRRAQTVVELKDGEALAIGGLFQHDYANNVAQIPGLGSIPILGALFRSAQWKRDESELLIIVTPRLATPADFAAAKQQVALSGEEPSTPSLLFNGQSLDKPMSPMKGGK